MGCSLCTYCWQPRGRQTCSKEFSFLIKRHHYYYSGFCLHFSVLAGSGQRTASAVNKNKVSAFVNIEVKWILSKTVSIGGSESCLHVLKHISGGIWILNAVMLQCTRDSILSTQKMHIWNVAIVGMLTFKFFLAYKTLKHRFSGMQAFMVTEGRSSPERLSTDFTLAVLSRLMMKPVQVHASLHVSFVLTHTTRVNLPPWKNKWCLHVNVAEWKFYCGPFH